MLERDVLRARFADDQVRPPIADKCAESGRLHGPANEDAQDTPCRQDDHSRILMLDCNRSVRFPPLQTPPRATPATPNSIPRRIPIFHVGERHPTPSKRSQRTVASPNSRLPPGNPPNPRPPFRSLHSHVPAPPRDKSRQTFLVTWNRDRHSGALPPQFLHQEVSHERLRLSLMTFRVH